MRPSIRILSLTAMGIPVSGWDLPAAIIASAAFASARALSSHTSRYAWIPASFSRIESRYAFVRSSAEYSLASNARRASAIVNVSRFMVFCSPLTANCLLFSAYDLLHRNAVAYARRRRIQECFCMLSALNSILIGTHYVAQRGDTRPFADVCFLYDVHELQNRRNLLFQFRQLIWRYLQPRKLRHCHNIYIHATNTTRKA